MSSGPFEPTNFERRRRAPGTLRSGALGPFERLGRVDLGDIDIAPESIEQPAGPPPTPATPEPTSSAPPAPAAPSPPPVSVPVPVPMATPPQAPPANPFPDLAFPSPGDRIKAEDFRRLSQALRIIGDTYALAGAAFGMPFGQVKLALVAQQYEIAHVVSVYGTELTNLGDTSLDDRRVLSVTPLVLGERRVSVVLSEQAAAGAKPTMVDLTGLTYSQAQARLATALGDVLAGGPVSTPDLTGLTLSEAAQRLGR